MRKAKFIYPDSNTLVKSPTPLQMDFSSQTRLKLRVAVIVANSFESNPQHHRVVGVKRDSGSVSAPVILRQFLLLLPLDSTFSDLKSLTLGQYEKLYKSQSNYLPLKSVVLFKDANHCDLDWDYLVGDICSSNELVYAVVEVEEFNKKIKISYESVISKSDETAPPKSPMKQQQQNQQPQQPSKPQNQEKKVPEFKPTPIKAPTAKINTDLKPQVSSETVKEAIVIKPKPIEVKKPAQQPPIQQKKSQEKPTPKEIKNPEEPVKIEAQAQVIKIEENITEKPSIEKTVTVSQKEESIVAVPTATAFIAESSFVEPPVIDTVKEAVVTSAPESVITPGPTPAPRSIFVPRKSPIENGYSSSEDDDDSSVLNTFDATSLFGGPVIASEPRRSDPFVLFAAGSSSEEEEEESQVTVVPVKCSSIVSLQASTSTSSELESSGSSDDEDSEILNNTDPSTSLPQSVTLRRLSSVSPIPEPSEIPSLNELKESLVRAPTPSQIVQSTATANTNKSPKKQRNFFNNKRGRPAKKQLNGRPNNNNNNNGNANNNKN